MGFDSGEDPIEERGGKRRREGGFEEGKRVGFLEEEGCGSDGEVVLVGLGSPFERSREFGEGIVMGSDAHLDS